MLYFLYNIVFYVKSVLFVNPIRNLYFRGPWVNGWGFWSGKTIDEICTYINPSTNQLHWLKNNMECLEIVEKRFDSFMVIVNFTLYLFAIYKIIEVIWFRFFVMGPLAREVAMHIEPTGRAREPGVCAGGRGLLDNYKKQKRLRFN